MPIFPQVQNPPQVNAPVIVNGIFEALEHQGTYGYSQLTSALLVWGYLGGRWGGFSIASGTFTLTDASDNYIVVEIATGATTCSATATNWNDTTNFVRVYKITTASGAVTTIEDHRAGPGGVHGGGGGGAATDIAATIHAATGKTTPVDADEIGIVDSAASNVLKKLTFANLGAWVWAKLGALINGGTDKTTPVDADSLPLSDSAASNATKRLTWANLKATLATYIATLGYATTSYVDTTVNARSWKNAVRAATTSAHTLATDFENGDTIDGVVLATGDRVLVKDQASGAENGIYTVNASGAPTRAVDADAGSELVNATVAVSEGTTNADRQYTCTTDAPITLGSTSLTWTQTGTGSGGITALTGDVTASGSGSVAATIANDAVTYAKMQNVSATNKVLGRITAGAGDVEEISTTGSGDVVRATAATLVTPALGTPASGTLTNCTGLPSSGITSLPVLIQIACSDETTALTAGTGKVTFRAPYAFTLTAVRASVNTAPTGTTLLTIDINEAGVSVLSTKLTFDASEKTTATAATAAVISDSAIADDAEISIDIDSIGSTTAGAGLKLSLIGTKP